MRSRQLSAVPRESRLIQRDLENAKLSAVDLKEGIGIRLLVTPVGSQPIILEKGK